MMREFCRNHLNVIVSVGWCSFLGEIAAATATIVVQFKRILPTYMEQSKAKQIRVKLS